MDEELIVRDGRSRAFADMFVMREQKHLGAAGECGQGVQGGGGASFVELDQEVIGDERDGASGVEGRLQAGEAKGQVELVGGPEAEPPDPDGRRLLTGRAEGGQRGPVGVGLVDLKAAERAEG